METSNLNIFNILNPKKYSLIKNNGFFKRIISHFNVTTIEAHAFNNKQLTHVIIPRSVTTIGNYAFAYNQLSEVEIPSSVTTIGNCAFAWNQLSEVKISNGVMTIGDDAFRDNHLSEVEIPSSVTTIGDSAFWNNELSEVTIPTSVTMIGDSAFRDNQLRKVKISTSVTTIGNSAFRNNQLSEVIIPTSVTTIGNFAFLNNQLREVTIPTSVTTIGNFAFSNNQLSEVTIPTSVILIGENAFDEDVILKNSAVISQVLDIINNVSKKKITNIDEFYNKNDNVKKICSELVKLKLSNQADNIEKYNEILAKMEKIYPKTRLEWLPSMEVLDKMDMAMIENFDLKVWREIAGYDIFIHDSNTKNALLEMISVFGLFEKDKNKQNRLNEVKNVIRNIDYRLSREQYNNLLNDHPEIENWFVECKVKELKLKEGMTIPEDLSFYFKERITPARYKYIKNLTGNEGKRVNEALNELYDNVESIYYVNNHKNTKEENAKLRDIMITSDIIGKINVESIHRMFSNCPKEYNEEVYKFLMKYLFVILEDEKIQTLVPDILINFHKIKKEYDLTDTLPTLKQCVDYCRKNKFKYSFGNKELSDMAARAGVSTQEAYQFYEDTNKELQERKTSVLVRHEDIYEYNGIILKGGLLRSDDSSAMFVGETNRTNCCQRYKREGHQCTEHSATSKDGGIFEVSYLKDGEWILLTESWDWQNEGVYCHDNIEATGELKKHPELKDAVMFVYSKDAEKIIMKSSDEIDEYIEKRLKQLGKINISVEEKEKEIERLTQLKQRQKIKVVTVGKGYSDIKIDKYFPEIMKDTRLPKGYKGYSDAKEGQQHIIAGDVTKLLPENTNYEQLAIYKDERRITTEYGQDIKESTLKLLFDIESEVYPDDMKMYSDGDAPRITTPSYLSEVYGENVDNLRVLHGEDWYVVYAVCDDRIEVYDMARGKPRLEEEKSEQTTEINNSLKLIVDEAVKEGKKVVADLKEDTSYLLYLMYKKSGLIEQLGEDVEYEFSNRGRSRVVSLEEQLEKLKKMKEIRQNKNPNLLMHRIEFMPSKKYLELYQGNNKNVTK